MTSWGWLSASFRTTDRCPDPKTLPCSVEISDLLQEPQSASFIQMSIVRV